jgi:phosphoheptose isomerase
MRHSSLIFVNGASISTSRSREESQTIRSQLTTRLRRSQQERSQSVKTLTYRVLCPECSAAKEPPITCATCGPNMQSEEIERRLVRRSPSPRSHLTGVALEADPSNTVVLNDRGFRELTEFSRPLLYSAVNLDFGKQ